MMIKLGILSVPYHDWCNFIDYIIILSEGSFWLC